MKGEADALGSLRFTRFRLTYKVLERAVFPAEKPPLFRRHLVTSMRDAACGPACPLQSGPLPFVYVPPVDTRTMLLPGDALKATFVLVGSSVSHAACCIVGLDRHTRKGVGPQRCRVILEQVDWLDPRDRLWSRYYFTKEQEIRSTPVAFDARHLEERAKLLAGRTRLTLQLTTPLRLPAPVDGHALLGALHARISQLGVVWCEGNAPAAPPHDDLTADLSMLLPRPRARRTTEWNGHVTLTGTLTPWLAPLVAGQHIGLGAGAALGYGRYELRP